TLFLLGVVLRGSAFAFRSLDHTARGAHRWGRVFSVASLVSPFLLGAMVAAVASGRVAPGSAAAWAWCSPFSLACGALAVALAGLLAATYLTVEVTEPALRDDFRRRALAAGVAAGLAAALALLLARRGAPLVFAGLTARPFTWPLHGATAAAAVGTLAALWRRRFPLARVLVAAQVALVICGWAASQYPFLVPPALTLESAAAPARTRTLLLTALGAGVPVL